MFTNKNIMARRKVDPRKKITRVSIWVKQKHVPRAERALKVIEKKINKLS